MGRVSTVHSHQNTNTDADSYLQSKVTKVGRRANR